MGNWTPSIVPTDDQSVFLVLDDFGRLGRARRETDVDSVDIETVITGLLQGQYSDPVRVIGFNTSEGWSRDVSEDVAHELRYRCDRLGLNIPANLEGFIQRYENREQSQLRLV